MNCLWLTEIIKLSDFEGDWKKYDDYLYSIFVRDFINNTIMFNGKPVRIRRYPEQCNREQSYFHITNKDSSVGSTDPNDRIPDLRRCERIEWIKLFIENYNCTKGCDQCTGIKVWKEPYKGNSRWHFLFEEFKFLVIIEERTEYNLLISGFYIFNDTVMKKKLRRYNRFKDKTKNA
ncbi:hypothetical protein LI034_07620 [Clostridium perfringens]|uniref:hypothetical protein n=1 Tax=Clostridium perfringens TaxID=1502 RepID=UPI002247032F|nr:hypothetical protein [Clostridium perfringens]MCX0360865.1 hypothetical protein [Clostridium perfringens]